MFLRIFYLFILGYSLITSAQLKLKGVADDDNTFLHELMWDSDINRIVSYKNNLSNKTDLDCYYIAYVDWYIVVHNKLYMNGNEIKETCRQEAINILDNLISKNKFPIDSRLLKARILFSSIDSHISELNIIKSEIDKLLSYVESVDKGNPRINVIRGALYTAIPEAFGGNVGLAKQELFKAIKNFKSYSDKEYNWFNWGKEEPYLWLGILYSNTDRPLALKYFEKVLEIAPNHIWVKKELIPNLSINDTDNNSQQYIYIIYLTIILLVVYLVYHKIYKS